MNEPLTTISKAGIVASGGTALCPTVPAAVGLATAETLIPPPPRVPTFTLEPLLLPHCLRGQESGVFYLGDEREDEEAIARAA